MGRNFPFNSLPVFVEGQNATNAENCGFENGGMSKLSKIARSDNFDIDR